MTREIATSTGGSSRRREQSAATRPTTTPSAIPPTAATTNPTRASDRTKLPVTTASTAARYATRAVASLKRDSPSMRVTTRRGAPSRRKTRRGRERVGRRDDRAERERTAPAEVRDDRMRHHGDDDHREEHEADREAQERREVRAQIAARRRDRGAEEQRRQEDQQDQLRLELDRGRPGTNARPRPPSTSRVGIRDAEPAGELVQDRDRDEDGQDRGQGLHDCLIRCLCAGLTNEVWGGDHRVLTLERLQGLACRAWHRRPRPASWSSPT